MIISIITYHLINLGKTVSLMVSQELTNENIDGVNEIIRDCTRGSSHIELYIRL